MFVFPPFPYHRAICLVLSAHVQMACSHVRIPTNKSSISSCVSWRLAVSELNCHMLQISPKDPRLWSRLEHARVQL